jgi:hypothetical protein
MTGPTVICTALPGCGGAAAAAAAVAVALALEEDGAALAGGDGSAVVIEVGGEGRRGPTVLAAAGARELECQLREAGMEAAARGRLAWVRVDAGERWLQAVIEARGVAMRTAAVVVVAPEHWCELAECPELAPDGAVLVADLPHQSQLCALAARELIDAGLRVRVIGRGPGRVGSRRALAGIDPGGDAGRKALRIAHAIRPARGAVRMGANPAAQAGQALPLLLGGALVLAFCALILAAIGGAVSGKSRVQRVADLSALSAARSMRDDFDRLFVPARLPGGQPNPAHLSTGAYLARAEEAALEAAEHNATDPRRLTISFPDADSIAPVRARVRVAADLDLAAGTRRSRVPVVATAVAEAVVPATGADAPNGAPSMATGGGYSGPLAYRQGKPMRPDVAAAFDRMAAAASADGVAITITSAFRSDAEQAALFAANPDPRWVAPPGTSLHRCATELDLGPSAAYGWLAANADRFGFLKRYSWEPWHFGYIAGPEPCSATGDEVGTGGSAEPPGDGGAPTTLPAFVPARFREPLLAAAGRWNVSADLLAAQLMAESNFNPFAVSPVGAAGIAQFMPSTAAAYGLADPFDAEAAIDAQAHLMSDLLGQFDGRIPLALAAYNAGPAPVAACGCVPAYPETQAYVAKILGLMDGAGQVVAPTLEVRLVA